MSASKNRLIRKIKQAINDFGMIQGGDKVLLGISGGKDSMVLAYLMYEYRKVVKDKFDIHAVYISKDFLGEDVINFEDKRKYFEDNFDFQLEKVEINLPDDSKLKDGLGKNCQRCAYARRIAIMKTCQNIGANKIILGHHMDDIVVTTLINMIEGRKLKIMPPINKMRKGDIAFIRPMAYIREKEILNFANLVGIPYSQYKCPIGENTMRNKVKNDIVWENEKMFPKYTENIFWSLIRDFKDKHEATGYHNL